MWLGFLEYFPIQFQFIQSIFLYNGWMYYERQKAKSEVQRGKPKGTLEGEIRIAIWVLEQRPKVNWCVQVLIPFLIREKRKSLSLLPSFPRQFPSSSSASTMEQQQGFPASERSATEARSATYLEWHDKPWDVASLVAMEGVFVAWLCASVEVSAATDNATGVSKMPRQSWICDSLFASPRSPQALWCGSSTTDPSTISLLTTGQN